MKNNKNLFFFILISILFSLSSSNFANELTKKSVYYISVLKNWGAVDSAYTNYLETTFNELKDNKNIHTVIIEIDTPGGSIEDAEKIVKLITALPYPTITYITNSAFSAGALISLAATYTVMAPHSKVGAMEPVNVNPQSKKMDTAPEKIISAMRASIRSLAEVRQKRLIEDIKLKKRTIDDIKWLENLPITATAMVDKSIKLNLKDHGLELSDKQLLTLTADQAERIGFSDYTVSGIQDILIKFKINGFQLIEMKPKMKHIFISFLTNPIVLMILLSLGILGLYVEIRTPGWGIPGTFGVLSLSLFFYANIVAGNASWEAPVLFIIGLVLLGLEIFVIPGFGIVGIAGIILIFASFFTGLGVKFQNFSETKHIVGRASAIIGGSIIFSVLLIYLAMKFLPKTRLFPKLVLTDAELGYRAHEDMSELVGSKGIAVSTLRPSGIAVIDDKRLDVITEGSFIEKNTKICVVDVQGGRIVVQADE